MTEITIKKYIQIIFLVLIGITVFYILFSFAIITSEIAIGITRNLVHKINLFFNIK